MDSRRAPQWPEGGRRSWGRTQIAWLCWAVTSALVIGNVPLLIAVDTWRFEMFPATERPLAAVSLHAREAEDDQLGLSYIPRNAVTREPYPTQAWWLGMAPSLCSGCIKQNHEIALTCIQPEQHL